MTIAVIIAAAAVIMVVIWCIHTTNAFKRKEIRVEESASGIGVALEKRYDMLTKMLDTAKNYAEYEQETVFRSISLRQGMSMKDMDRASSAMDSMAEQINLTAEAYPQLGSSDVFVQLQAGIRDAEDHLQAARRLYNASVRDFNTAIKMFPASLLAGGRTEKEFSQTPEHKREDVDMSF